MEHLKKLFYFLHITKHKFLRPKKWINLDPLTRKTDKYGKPFYTKNVVHNRKNHV